MTVWHEASGYRYAGAVIFLIVLSWIASIGRIVVRTLYIKKFGWDDVFLIITLLISTAYGAVFLAILKLTNGGVSADHVPPGQLVPSINLILTLIVLYIAGTCALKVACGLLLLRVLVRRWQVWIIYGGMAVSVLYGTIFFFLCLFQCGNPSQFHIRVLFGGSCMSPEVVDGTSYAHSALICSVDLVFAVLPVALIWDTNMSRRSKMTVAGILGLGSVAVIATFARFGYVNDLTKPGINFFKTAQPIGFLAALELAIGVTCISMCTYKPLFRSLYRPGEYESFVSADGLRPQQPWPKSSTFGRSGNRTIENTKISMSTWRGSKEADPESDVTSLASPVKTPQTFANALHSNWPSPTLPPPKTDSPLRNHRCTV